MSKRNLLLVSTSTVFGTGYLDHCESAVRELFEGAGRLLFVPYALHDRDGYAAVARKRFEKMGLRVESVHGVGDPRAALAAAEGVFIGGGNTFRLLRALQEGGLMEVIRERVREGMPYMGTSAGSNMACPTLKTTNDMPIVEPRSFEALGLVPFQINPHYLDPEPGSKHMGETRETRIKEYLEENELPVVGLREGAWLRVRGDRMELGGLAGARIFRRGVDPEEVTPPADLSALLLSP